MTPCPISIVLVEDHLIVREGIRMIIADDPQLEIVGETDDIDEALRLIRNLKPNVVVLDMHLADTSSADHIRDIKDAAADCRTVIWTGFDDEEANRSALAQGAHGIVLKMSSSATLTTAIKKVHQGEAWIDRAMAARVLTETHRRNHLESATDLMIRSLTPREREIIDLIGEGLVNKDIARKLNISEKTVRNHLTTTFSKLQLTSRLELMLFASRNKLITL